MNNIQYSIVMLLLVISCTKEKTDYESEIRRETPVEATFEEALILHSDSYILQVFSLNGKFYKGYNAIRVKVYRQEDKQVVALRDLQVFPLLEKNEMERIIAPHSRNYTLDSDRDAWLGYTIFTDESDAGHLWQLQLNIKVAEQNLHAIADILVEAQPNKNLNMTTFSGLDGDHYLLALIEPMIPRVAENTLIAGIYKLNNELTYEVVNGYRLRLDPRMPEPSMGNHSSPNNKDLQQRQDGWYAGMVNYTMTGNWTLNFILENEKGRIVKGTPVPTDHTPGVDGVKSELFIDIVF